MTSPSENNKKYWALALIFVLFSMAIGAAGYFFYEHQKKSFKEERQHQINAIADMKIRQILNWRRERMEDVMIYLESPFPAHHVHRFLRSPKEIAAKQEILEWMAIFIKHHQYINILLLDSKGDLRLQAAEGEEVADPHTKILALEAMEKKEVVFSDFFRNEPSRLIRLSLLVPLYVPHGEKATPLGILVFEIDPHLYLYPVIQSWPIPSRTSEILLIRREGEGLVFLNELRHQKETALTLRFPMSEDQMPAVMAVKGKEGIVEGLDYRRVPVLASVRSIPDSPWFLVAKVDQEEIYAPIQSLAMFTATMTGLLIAGTVMTLIFLFRHQSASFFKRQYKAEFEHRMLLQHSDYLTRYTNDIILLMDEELRIVEANDRATLAYGYPREELLGLNLKDLRAPETRSALDSQFMDLEKKKGLVLETLHQRKNGTRFPVENSSRLIEVDGKRFYQSIIRDITERKRTESLLRRSEQAALRLSRENAVMAEIGRIISSTLNPDEVYEHFAEEVAQLISFDRIAINTVNHKDDTLTIAYIAGEAIQERRVGDTFPLRGSISEEVLKERSAFAFQTEDENEVAERFPGFLHSFRAGNRSIIAVPLISKDHIIGVLHFRSAKVNAYTERDLELAQRVGHQIAGAIASAQFFEERGRLLDQLRSGQEQLRHLSRRLVEVQEAERRHLAAELHDKVGQNLTAMNIHLNFLNSQISIESMEKIGFRLGDLLKLLEESVKSTRDVMVELRPPVLDDYGLASALHWYCEQLSARTGLSVVIRGNEFEPRLPIASEMALFRICQEALNNVVKHARASGVTITLEDQPGKVCLIIADNGSGFDPAPKPFPMRDPRFGLITMRERALAVNGKLRIESQPGKGTKVIAEVPY